MVFSTNDVDKLDIHENTHKQNKKWDHYVKIKSKFIKNQNKLGKGIRFLEENIGQKIYNI